jgi:hypothetical protein
LPHPIEEDGRAAEEIFLPALQQRFASLGVASPLDEARKFLASLRGGTPGVIPVLQHRYLQVLEERDALKAELEKLRGSGLGEER